jgi:hypothetical protein
MMKACLTSEAAKVKWRAIHQLDDISKDPAPYVNSEYSPWRTFTVNP